MISHIIFILISVFIIFYSNHLKNNELQFSFSSDAYPLVVGIISSRENFAKRQTIRETWLNVSLTSYAHSFKSWFIIGKRGCVIPPQCRADKYHCDELFVNNSGITEYFYSSLRKGRNYALKSKLHTYHPGFIFKVNHPVVVLKLGLPRELLIPNETILISLKNLQTKDIVVKTHIKLINQTEISDDDFVYKDVENFLLPKDYEGLLIVEGYLYHASSFSSKWNNGGGVISFKRVYVSQHDHESLEFSETMQVAPAIAFKVLNVNDWKSKAYECTQGLLERKALMENETKKLIEERDKWGDIVLVDVVDTYRSLPRKLLLFYKWLVHNIAFNSVLKTDDDCIIDIAAILSRLKSDEMLLPHKKWLWSRFRYEWSLNLIGKWSDFEYKAPYYPMFPCGGGYVISRAVVQWLSDNADHLHPYQGEDVSIAIWLAAINAHLIQDLNWECDSRCKEGSYNRAQLNSSEIVDSWNTKIKCQNICQC